jgi:hypothetical protein
MLAFDSSSPTEEQAMGSVTRQEEKRQLTEQEQARRRVGVRAIPGFGVGVFATQRLAPHTVLGEYEGVLLEPDVFQSLYPADHPPAKFAMQLADGAVLDAADPCLSNWTREVNNCGPDQAPNVVFAEDDGRVFLVTTAVVEPCVQLLCEYGAAFRWHGTPRVNIPTRIGSVIRDDDTSAPNKEKEEVAAAKVLV